MNPLQNSKPPAQPQLAHETLFAITQALRDTIGRVDPDTGEIDESHIRNLDLFQRKAVGCIAYLIEEEAQIDAAEKVARQMLARVAARRARYERFHDYVRDAMAVTHTDSIEHQHGLFVARLYRDRDASVQLQEGVQFPADLCADPKPPEPSKSKIRAAIEAGRHVLGAELVRRPRLTIR